MLTADGYKAYMWRDGQQTILSSLSEAPLSEAVSVNDKGLVVGWSDRGVRPADVPDLRIAMVWQGGKYKTIPPSAGYDSSKATGCDNQGNVWGQNSLEIDKTGLWKSERFVARGSGAVQMPPSGDGSVAICFSRKGGVTLAVSKDGREIIRQDGTGRRTIGSLTASTGRVAHAVCNDRGDAALTFSMYTEESSEQWRNTDVLWAESWSVSGKSPKHTRLRCALKPLRDFPHCFAAAINDSHGDVVGTAYARAPDGRNTYSHRDSRAVLWKQDGTMMDLNEQVAPNSGWVLFNANGINDRGWIVGSGTLNGKQNGFLLIPNSLYQAHDKATGVAAVRK